MNTRTEQHVAMNAQQTAHTLTTDQAAAMVDRAIAERDAQWQAKVDTLQAERDELQAKCDRQAVCIDDAGTHALFSYIQLVELRTQLEAARKDAERYRWLRHGDNDDKMLKSRCDSCVAFFTAQRKTRHRYRRRHRSNERNDMTKPELLRVMRLLSALESLMLTKERMPDYLHDDLQAIVEILELEILK
jgi:hypothetical protein